MDDGTDALVDALAQTTFAVTALLSRLAAEHDLSLTQLRLLAILRDRDRVGVTALAQHLGLEKSTLSGLVDRGARRGLLARESGTGDGRAVDVVLTPAGLELAERLRGRARSLVGGLTSTLGTKEQQRLVALLEQIHPGPGGRP